MVHPYFPRIPYRLRKKRLYGCHKTRLENRNLLLIGGKNEIWSHFTYWVYSKHLLLATRLKKILNDNVFFEGAISKDKDCRLTLCTVHKDLRKCGYCPNVFRNV